MCFQLCLFDNVVPLIEKVHNVVVPDGRKIRVEYMGDVSLPNGLRLKEVLFVPNFNYNLISVHKLTTQLKCSLTFNTNQCVLQEQLKKHLLLGKNHKGLYYLQPVQNRDSKDCNIHGLTSQTADKSIE